MYSHSYSAGQNRYSTQPGVQQQQYYQQQPQQQYQQQQQYYQQQAPQQQYQQAPQQQYYQQQQQQAPPQQQYYQQQPGAPPVMPQPQNYDFVTAALYYMNSCPHSYKFMSLLQEYPMLMQKVHFYPVDPPVRPPAFVREVPLIYVNNNQVFSGPAAFHWLERQAKRSFQDSGSFGSTAISQGNTTNTKGGESLEFSFIGGNTANTETANMGLPVNSPAVLFSEQQTNFPTQQQQGGQYVLPPALRSQQVSSADNKINTNNMSALMQQKQAERMNVPKPPPPQLFQQRG